MSFTAAALGAGTLAALGASARWNWWRLPAEGVPILMYHKIGDPPPGSKLKKLWVSTAVFRRQMDYLARRGYKPVTFADIDGFRARGEALPKKSMVITFDDGYKNNHDNALPVLKEYGFRAVIYLVVNAMDSDNFWHDPSSETRIPMLSWKEAETMQSAGVEIGSHTMNHIRMEKVEINQAVEELEKSRDILEQNLGKKPAAFAYPYGNGADSPALQNAVRAAGYTSAVSVHQGLGDFKTNPFNLKRIFVRGDDLMFDFHLNITRGRARF